MCIFLINSTDFQQQVKIPSQISRLSFYWDRQSLTLLLSELGLNYELNLIIKLNSKLLLKLKDDFKY